MRRHVSLLGSCLLVLFAAAPAHAIFHLYDIREVYSSADGSVQFVELFTEFNNQQFLDLHTIVASQDAATATFTFAGMGPAPTGGRTLLVATASFEAACGIAPDFILPDDFLFSPDGGVNFGEGADSVAYDLLPLDGARSLHFPGAGVAPASPQNHAGETCSLPLSVSVVDQYLLDGSSVVLLDDDALAQSFTVGVDGLLEGIEVPVAPQGEPPVDLTFEVVDFSGGELATAPLLASVFVTPGEMGDGQALALETVSQTFVDLTSFGIEVSAGDVLAFSMDAPGVTAPDDTYAVSLETQDVYAGGERIGVPSSDLVFKTFVPEPSATLTALAAVVAASMIRLLSGEGRERPVRRRGRGSPGR